MVDGRSQKERFALALAQGSGKPEPDPHTHPRLYPGAGCHRPEALHAPKARREKTVADGFGRCRAVHWIEIGSGLAKAVDIKRDIRPGGIGECGFVAGSFVVVQASLTVVQVDTLPRPAQDHRTLRQVEQLD